MKKSYIVILLVILIGISLVNVVAGFFTYGGKEEIEIRNGGFSHVEIDTKNAEINLLVTNDRPYVELLNKGSYDLKVEVEGNTLDIEVNKKWFNLFSFNLFFHSPTLNVYLPENVYETIQSETDNGSVYVTNLKVNELNVETNNGKVLVRDVESSYLYLSSNNGDVNLENVEGKIIGETNNGDVTIQKSILNQPIELKTDNGNVSIITNEEPTNVTYQFKTHNGDITVFGSEHFETVVGDGKYLIQLTSHNGNITIKK